MCADPPAATVRAELDAILSSDLFIRSDRLSAFLKFIVEETLAGRGASLKEPVIAMAVYGKGADFNTALDPIVRVDARRLRDKLREYYATTPDAAVIVSVPKGTYVPVFASGGHTAAAAPPGAIRPPATAMAPARCDTRAVWIGLSAVALIAAVAFVAARMMREPTGQVRLLTVTALPGSVEDPTLSPDGSFVAFSWAGDPPTGQPDIWVKAVDGDVMRRLTQNPDAHDKWAEWSPDGRHIVFTRLSENPPSVIMVSSLGGPERVLAERGADATWMPDGAAIVRTYRTADGRVVLIHQVVESGAARELTQAPPGFVDMKPRVSPDGTMVAFVRSRGFSRVAVFVLPLAGGEPRQLTGWASGPPSGGLAWTPDGEALLYSRPAPNGRELVRVPVQGRGAVTPVAGVPPEAIAPATSRIRADGTYRLALSYGQPDIGLRMIHLDGQAEEATLTAATKLCDSTRVETVGRFSPDGTHVAFVSNRSGSQQVWVARQDGSELRSLTRPQDAALNVGSWSPDARHVAFDATVGDILVADRFR